MYTNFRVARANVTEKEGEGKFSNNHVTQDFVTVVEFSTCRYIFFRNSRPEMVHVNKDEKDNWLALINVLSLVKTGCRCDGVTKIRTWERGKQVFFSR